MTEIERRLRNLERGAEIATADFTGVDVTEHIAPAFQSLHGDLEAGRHQFYNLIGGRGSGKSSFVALEIISRMMRDKTGEGNAIIFRRTANTLRDSVYSQVAWAISELEADSAWRGSVSPMQFTYIPTGAQILFRGLDDPAKLKSIKAKQGYFRYIWIEEFNEIAGENFLRSVLQSTLRGGEAFSVFYSFNPPINRNNWANLYLLKDNAEATTHKSTYLVMPPAWLGQGFIAEAERLKEINPSAYRHEYLGEPVNTGGQVFPNIITRTIEAGEIDNLQYIYAGIDFGFSVDPAVYVRVAYDRKHETVYFLDEIYRLRTSNAELAEAIQERGYDVSAVREYHPLAGGITSQRARIVCDCAEPKSIADLKACGLSAYPCKKYPGSVAYGIKWLQHRTLVIDPLRTPQTYKEFINYEYLQTKDGEYLSDVPDKDNHCIDATRYALDMLINARKLSA